MNAPKFTPGPWSIQCHTCESPDEINIGSDWTISGEDGSAICVEGFDDLNASANVRLIAAAPDMYAALNALSAHFVGEWVNDPRSQDQIDAAKELAESQARAALAKARGETP